MGGSKLPDGNGASFLMGREQASCWEGSKFPDELMGREQAS